MIIMSEVSQPSTGVRLSQPQVVAYLDTHCAGEGTLCVSESQVTWICRSTGLGFSLTYPSIILHAISTDLSTFPQECIYVLVDANKSDLRLAEEELHQNGDTSDDDDDEEGKNLVIRFVPADLSVLQQIYSEMCACQELNPDEGDDFSEDEGEAVVAMDGDADAMMSGDGWYTANNIGEDDEIELSEEGRANLQRMLGHSNNGHGDHEEHEEDEMEEQQ